jgi:hypothetical protein
LNIIEWAATAKSVETDEDHEAESFGFDLVFEHHDGSWIGVTIEPDDVPKYFVTVSNWDCTFEKLSDAQVELWERYAKDNYNA